jgi:hypothetical protein
LPENMMHFFKKKMLRFGRGRWLAIWTIVVCSERANAFALRAISVPSRSPVPPQISSPKNWARVLTQAKKRTRLTATDQSAEERAAVLQASLGAAEKEIEQLRKSAGQPGASSPQKLPEKFISHLVCISITNLSPSPSPSFSLWKLSLLRTRRRSISGNSTDRAAVGV